MADVVMSADPRNPARARCVGCGDLISLDGELGRVVKRARDFARRHKRCAGKSLLGFIRSEEHKGQRTKMSEWRGGDIEFARSLYYDGPDVPSTNEGVCFPPWYAIEMAPAVVVYEGPEGKEVARQLRDANGKLRFDRPWHYWLDYKGPPMVFLTRRRAETQAKALRSQYGRSYRVRVVKLIPETRD